MRSVKGYDSFPCAVLVMKQVESKSMDRRTTPITHQWNPGPIADWSSWQNETEET